VTRQHPLDTGVNGPNAAAYITASVMSAVAESTPINTARNRLTAGTSNIRRSRWLVTGLLLSSARWRGTGLLVSVGSPGRCHVQARRKDQADGTGNGQPARPPLGLLSGLLPMAAGLPTIGALGGLGPAAPGSCPLHIGHARVPAAVFDTLLTPAPAAFD